MPCRGGDRGASRRSTAVSGSHRPLGRRPNRSSKSRMPQAISVRRSAADASGRIVWWKAWAIALPPPPPRRTARSVVGSSRRRATPRASARGPTRSGPGCRARRSAGSTRRRRAAFQSWNGAADGSAGTGRSTDRAATAGRSGRGPPAGRGSPGGRRRDWRGRRRPSPAARPRIVADVAGRERRPGRWSRTHAALVDELEAAPRSSRRSRSARSRRRRGSIDRRLDRDAELVVAGREARRRPPATSASSWAIRRPPTSWNAAGLRPPPRSIVDHSTPSRPSNGDADTFVAVDLDAERRVVAGRRRPGSSCAARAAAPRRRSTRRDPAPSRGELPRHGQRCRRGPPRIRRRRLPARSRAARNRTRPERRS